MPGVTATWVCFPCAPTTVTSLAPDAVLTMAETGTVSTGPSVCPVSTVTSTFSPFSAEASGWDGATVSGMNGVWPELLELLELLDPVELELEDEELAELEPLPMSTTVP